jgi:hypothetical protein
MVRATYIVRYFCTNAKLAGQKKIHRLPLKHAESNMVNVKSRRQKNEYSSPSGFSYTDFEIFAVKFESFMRPSLMVSQILLDAATNNLILTCYPQRGFICCLRKNVNSNPSCDLERSKTKHSKNSDPSKKSSPSHRRLAVKRLIMRGESNLHRI